MNQNETKSPQKNTVTPENDTVTPQNNTVAITNQPKKNNWKVRLKNKAFWLSIIPAVLLLAQVVAAVFGYSLDVGAVGDKLLAVVNALFVVLAILGVVADPTTAGLFGRHLHMRHQNKKRKKQKGEKTQ